MTLSSLGRAHEEIVHMQIPAVGLSPLTLKSQDEICYNHRIDKFN